MTAVASYTDALALRLFKAITNYRYEEIEELVEVGQEEDDSFLSNATDIEGNTFLHLVLLLIDQHHWKDSINIPSVDNSAPSIRKVNQSTCPQELNLITSCLQIVRDLKINCPGEESNPFLPLIAVAIFLIDNGCDWMAKNKTGDTAAHPGYSISATDYQNIRKIFKHEGHRYFMMNQLKLMSNSQLQGTVITNTSDLISFSLNQHGRTLRTNLAGKLKVYTIKSSIDDYLFLF